MRTTHCVKKDLSMYLTELDFCGCRCMRKLHSCFRTSISQKRYQRNPLTQIY